MTQETGYHHGGPLPGWYPDPSGDYESRWWDGTRWSDDVATGPYRGREALPPPGLVRLPPEHLVWEGNGHRLTSSRLWIDRPGSGRPAEEIPVWTVSGVHVASAMTVGVDVGYPGYTGPGGYRLRGVVEAPWVAAQILRWARRNRRAAHGL